MVATSSLLSTPPTTLSTFLTWVASTLANAEAASEPFVRQSFIATIEPLAAAVKCGTEDQATSCVVVKLVAMLVGALNLESKLTSCGREKETEAGTGPKDVDEALRHLPPMNPICGALLELLKILLPSSTLDAQEGHQGDGPIEALSSFNEHLDLVVSTLAEQISLFGDFHHLVGLAEQQYTNKWIEKFVSVFADVVETDVGQQVLGKVLFFAGMLGCPMGDNNSTSVQGEASSDEQLVVLNVSRLPYTTALIHFMNEHATTYADWASETFTSNLIVTGKVQPALLYHSDFKVLLDIYKRLEESVPDAESPKVIRLKQVITALLKGITPPSVATLTTEEVVAWFRKLPLLNDYTAVLNKEGIDGEVLASDLSVSELMEIGIDPHDAMLVHPLLAS